MLFRSLLQSIKEIQINARIIKESSFKSEKRKKYLATLHAIGNLASLMSNSTEIEKYEDLGFLWLQLQLTIC